MKIQFASDLHLEFIFRTFPKARVVQPAHDADLLILAGDIHLADWAIDAFCDWTKPIICVIGNHESYGGDLPAVISNIRERSARTNIHFLENNSLIINGVRFLGATLWTDYRIMDHRYSQAAAMDACESGLNDHTQIRLNGGPFRPAEALIFHQHSRAWLAKELMSTPLCVDKTVVISHHGPHPHSLHARYENNPMNGGFVSNLRDLVVQADFWIHGHVHDSFDYEVGKCRVMANPAGYARNVREARHETELILENPNFDPMLVFDTNNGRDAG